MQRLRYALAIFAAAGSAVARPSLVDFGSMSINNIFGRQTTDFFNPDDLTFIKKLAAVGDSYSAGIGAGDGLHGEGDENCRRYDHSYPYLINQDERLGDTANRKFQFKSCSGAVIKNVIEDQLPSIDSDQQIILLSAGGNDAELVNILNQCVYQWFALNDQHSTVGKVAEMKGEPWAKGWDWDAASRGCLGQLQYSKNIINDDEFSKRIDSMIEATKKKLSSDGMIYYTGYAKFWSTDYGSACDKVSWSTWIFPAARLEELRRREMNRLVDLINDKIEAAVKRAGDKVTFINYDEYVGHFKGRYCEDGVDESVVDSNTRPELMFYELDTFDPWGNRPWKRSTVEHTNGSFSGDMNTMARAAEFVAPDVTFRQEHKIVDDSEIQGLQAAAKEGATEDVPNLLPDGYGRVFHPQILLHELIANLVLFEVSNRRMEANDMTPEPLLDTSVAQCPINPSGKIVLKYKETEPGEAVNKGTELRILPVGDSITVGYLSDRKGGDGNGYRGQLKKDLSGDKVVFAGTESSGTMTDGNYAAWSGKTIQYISDHVDPSLKQRPNIILLAAGTNDMNPNHGISKEGNDPKGAADRLGKLIDKMVKACPDATILVAMIINTCDEKQSPATKEFQKLVPGVVKSRHDDGKHVLAVDFTTFKTSDLQDCIHPTNDGYKLMGDYWYSFIHQIPSSWIKKPVGPDPNGGDGTNGGIDKNIPAPDWGKSPIQVTSKKTVADAAEYATGGKDKCVICNGNPWYKGTGKIAQGGVGSNGDWKYHKDWRAEGQVAEGLGLENQYVRLHDMNGDGKADYVWIHPKTGEITCWLNNLPKPWSKAGNNNGIIGSGVGPAKTIYLADMNGDGMDDYLVVDPDNGSVRVWWNYGPDDSWDNGWRFVPGGEIASGVPHANLETLRFPDINGDGRADYVYIGEGGSLKHHLNTGSVGGRDVLFHAMGGIATGAVSDISKLVFADMNGDGRDDYLIWDEDGGLTGFLNQPTNKEGVPHFVNQGPAKTIADGIKKKPSTIRLADMDGDGKDDYVYVGDHGALSVWYNRGTTDDSMAIDGLRFADMDGDGVDDYVWLDPKTGAPAFYLNSGVNDGDSLGWAWSPINGGKPIASGAAPANQVVFGDINGDGLDDYLDLDPKTGLLKAYLNLGRESDWKFRPIGTIASGLGPGKRVRIADIDGDGRDDYIFLKDNGGTTIYRNIYGPDNDGDKYALMSDADASGINQSPDEIDFIDMNGDGKADYVWTSRLDGSVKVWYNDYPKKPTWREAGEIAGGVGTSGANIRYAKLQKTGRYDYVAVDPKTGAIAAWLNGCGDPDTSKKKHRITIARYLKTVWVIAEKPVDKDFSSDTCFKTGKGGDTRGTPILNTTADDKFPAALKSGDTMEKLYGNTCFYEGSTERVGKLVCDGVSGIRCYEDENFGKLQKCRFGSYTYSLYCEW
ncbi:lipolytic G-D-S-L family [Fusarium tjaetaba]|uniref:Lipolytic G-D-S-L family n=1 Tax=Fusarium tjaetaba TaxID=1567544 RepID=A0A8H5VEP6_9HYPO|nr:lipolytic G-D-S-L family [Fusarium tjaetaba]KAF5619593.1 lipolytic G-D-S-L family [Fusarium tjaetaba]